MYSTFIYFQSSVPGIQITIHYKTIVNIFHILCLIFLIEFEKSFQVLTLNNYSLSNSILLIYTQVCSYLDKMRYANIKIHEY